MLLQWNKLLLLALFISGIKASYKSVNVTRPNVRTVTATLISPDSDSISPLHLSVHAETGTRVRIRITDPGEERYEVPYPWKGGQTDGKGGDKIAGGLVMEVGEGDFYIKIARPISDVALFDTRRHGLVYQDQVLSLGTSLPSGVLYGLGEDAAPLQRNLNNKKHTLWNHGGPYETGQGINLYGTHPFYLNLETGGRANGVLLMNSNAMDIILQNDPVPSVTWTTIGGILDFTIFAGDSPRDVVAQYTERIGRPFLPPVWALGFHVSRWGYDSTAGMRGVMDGMVKGGVPVDVQWSDIDYMDGRKDFSYDPKKYSDLPDHVDYLHSLGKRFVPILDPAVKSDFSGNYKPTDTAADLDLLIRNASGGYIIGHVWPGDTVFPDFLNPDTPGWWAGWIAQLKSQLDFDGLWIDMNEPESFYDGSADGCPWDDPLENPPYYPAVRKSLAFGTLCLTARQQEYWHYDVHNLYGWSETRATRAALRSLAPRNRTFVLTRSTFVGSGRWAAHWTGDVHSTWEHLMVSVSGILNMNLLGIPLVGADICGFEHDTDRELCIRWTQLGAFYPFSRNHNSLKQRDQEPSAWDEEAMGMMRDALLQRYRLLLYLHQLFVRAHERGFPVANPLFLLFPQDTATHDKDRQFLWGEAIMVCPVLEKGATSVWIYFPTGRWYDLWTQKEVSGGEEVVERYPAPLEKIPVFGRGGSVIPVVMETPGEVPTAEGVLATREVALYCYLDGEGVAEGSLYVDDGLTEGKRDRHLVMIDVHENKMKLMPVVDDSVPLHKLIVEIRVGGLELQEINLVTLHQQGKTVKLPSSYDGGVLVIKSGELDTGDGVAVITWASDNIAK